MTIVLILLIAVVMVASASATLVVTRRRHPGIELEPPPAPPAPPTTPTPPPPIEQAPEAPPEAEITPEQVAELEAALQEPEVAPAPEPPAPAPEAPPVRPRFRDRLGKARSLFAGYVGSVRSRGKINEETWEDIEEALIRADVGVDTTTALLDDLRTKVRTDHITEPEALLDALKADLIDRLGAQDGQRELRYDDTVTPNVWLFVGVNGVGKTTTIGKLGLRAKAEGHEVLMAAADTFRAAAADQLELWAKRVGADLVRGAEGGDPGAVVFDAKERAAARHTDLILADTAGRLHTKVNLMEELKKVRRVAERPPGQVTEVLLVIDATTGQNGLVQAKEFAAAVGVTGIVLTKLDGTAKGGIAVAIQTELGLPIKLVGLGEAPEDLVDFDEHEFVDALFG